MIANVTGPTDTAAEIDTAMKVVFLGAALTIVESMVDIAFADFYAGEFDGVIVTTMEIILITVIGLCVALGIVWHAYAHRDEPTRKTSLVVIGLAVLSLLGGWLLANLITIIGAAIGDWESRPQPADAPETTS